MFLGETEMFNYNETLQRALLQWNRAATQGRCPDRSKKVKVKPLLLALLQ